MPQVNSKHFVQKIWTCLFHSTVEPLCESIQMVYRDVYLKLTGPDFLTTETSLGDHKFSTYAKSSTKLTFLAPWYARHVHRDHSFSTCAKLSEKLTILIPLIRTRTSADQGVRNVSFSEYLAYVLNEWFHIKESEKLVFREIVCFYYLFHDRGRYHIETSPLICRVNQWTHFYMITASIINNPLEVLEVSKNCSRHGNHPKNMSQMKGYVEVHVTLQIFLRLSCTNFTCSLGIICLISHGGTTMHLLRNCHNKEFCYHFYITHSFPMHPFSTPWKHQKTLRCIGNEWVKSAVFKARLKFLSLE